ncbi:hypothetical protein OG909_18430 [Streptomyces sp. NBC_01754]|uniref:hypothetical protein n=1 Tax=Streptomyces sp. NBC_01754 TaxID=2975930 RepID=UPI002DD7A4E7|nr:hypothetical protein [Streptomyces sp. NBC_01754]WSC94087.1 hypothetical protein OG909_18430 [Streptomyces sp. NBC_01754]
MKAENAGGAELRKAGADTGTGPDAGTGAGADTGAGAGRGGAAERAGAVPAGGSGADGRRRAPAWAVAGLPVLAMLVGVLLGVLGLLLRIIGVVLLCRSRHWDWNQKRVGVTVTAVLPTVIALAYNFGVSSSRVPAYVPWLLTGLILVMVAVGAGWLWKVRTVREQGV